MEDLTGFFNYLSWRVYKENNLSDVTWALCKANKNFNKLFLDYCFNEDTPEMDIFEREVPSNNSRPDFYCKDFNGVEWIIEVKIYDRSNLHFEQYRKEFEKAKIAFIANYDASSLCDKKLQISVKTWRGFIDFLIKKIDNSLLNGYIRYLKNVIGYLEVENMNLNNVISLPDFNRIIENIIRENEGRGLSLYNKSSYLFFERYGRYVLYEKKNKWFYFWIGIYFGTEEFKSPFLLLEAKVDDEKSIPKNIASVIKNIKKGEYWHEPYPEDGAVYFELTDKYHDILFSDNPNIEKQKEIISNSINEFISYLE